MGWLSSLFHLSNFRQRCPSHSHVCFARRSYFLYGQDYCRSGTSEHTTAPASNSVDQKSSTLSEDGILLAACVVIAAGSLSIFCYSSEWNTYALYFREVWGWGSAWTGFAQMAGDLLAGDVGRSNVFSSSVEMCLSFSRRLH